MASDLVFYIISVSFQLSGAILLLIKYCFVNIGKKVAENREKETHVDGDGCIVLGNTQPTPSDYAENVWLNRIAFAMIAIGYLTSVWGDIDNHQRPMAFIVLLIVSTVMTLAALWLSKKLSVKRTNSDLWG